MECPLERQQHANCPEGLEGNKGDGFSQASEKCGLLVVIFTGDGRSHPHAFSGQIQRWYKGSSVCKMRELWASEAPNNGRHQRRGCKPRPLHALVRREMSIVKGRPVRVFIEVLPLHPKMQGRGQAPP